MTKNKQLKNMDFIRIERKENFAIVALDRGKSNPMNHQLVMELRKTVADILANTEIKGMILTGKEHFFTAGLDLLELFHYDQDQFRIFWSDFAKLIYELAAFDKPLVCAITGHSPAGGTVMAVCADYRIMAEGNYKIGLNEIPVGIVVPEGIFALYATLLGEKRAYQYLLEGKLYAPQHALEIGMVDEVVAADLVLEKAEAQMRIYTGFNENAWRITKGNLRRNILARMDFSKGDEFEKGQQQWWSSECRAILQGFVDKFGKK